MSGWAARIGAAIIAASTVVGSTGAANALTGNDLQRMCGLDEGNLAAHCEIGIASTVRGAYAMDALFRGAYHVAPDEGQFGCFDGKYIDGQQVIAMVLRDYRDAPETRSVPLEVMVISALKSLYPCAKPFPQVLQKRSKALQ